MERNHLFDCCLGKSAQAWCEDSTSAKIMDSDLATEFAKTLFVPVTIIEELIDVIQHMTPSEGLSSESEPLRSWLWKQETLEKATNYINNLKKIMV